MAGEEVRDGYNVGTARTFKAHFKITFRAVLHFIHRYALLVRYRIMSEPPILSRSARFGSEVSGEVRMDHAMVSSHPSPAAIASAP
jgi:hypothetical protein